MKKKISKEIEAIIIEYMDLYYESMQTLEVKDLTKLKEEYLQTTVVVINRYEKDGKLVEILINSNTVNLENYPISAYTYPYYSLIKIYGWNN